jgi:hypothetical protein
MLIYVLTRVIENEIYVYICGTEWTGTMQPFNLCSLVAGVSVCVVSISLIRYVLSSSFKTECFKTSVYNVNVKGLSVLCSDSVFYRMTCVMRKYEIEHTIYPALK